MTKLPDDVRAEIDKFLSKFNSQPEFKDGYENGFEFGYRLASKRAEGLVTGLEVVDICLRTEKLARPISEQITNSIEVIKEALKAYRGSDG